MALTCRGLNTAIQLGLKRREAKNSVNYSPECESSEAPLLMTEQVNGDSFMPQPQERSSLGWKDEQKQHCDDHKQ